MKKRSPEKIKRLVDLYRDVVVRPGTPVSARIHSENDGNLTVSSLWSHRNLERNQMTSVCCLHQVNLQSNRVSLLSSIDVSNEVSSALSTTEEYRAVVRQVPDGSKKKQFLEIWWKGRVLWNFDIAALDLHGDIYTDDEFGGLSWSSQDRYLAYVAEKKRPKAEPFYKQAAATTKTKDSEGENFQGEEFTYVEDWGEQLVGKSQSVIGLCNLRDGDIQILEVPTEYCPGQLVWSANDTLYGIALDTSQRRLGLVYCTNRPGLVFSLKHSGEFSILSHVGKSARSPRLGLDEVTLVWLERDAGGPHDGCERLMSLDTKTKKISQVIPIVDDKISVDGEDFYGIFDGRLPKRCFRFSEVFFNTVQKYSSVCYAVDISTGKIRKVCNGRILDFDGARCVVATSSFNCTPNLQIYTVESSSFLPLTESVPIGDVDQYDFTKVDLDNMNYMLFKRRSLRLPLIVMPHGGPHGVLVDNYMAEPNFLVNLGFSVLLVNYRGSTGFGESSVNSLPGHIGDIDVKDVQRAVVDALDKNPDFSGSKIVAYGGSHGGFLSLQLVGQYPDFYKAAVVRNPVVDLPSMFVSSDIPDWVSIESGSVYPYSRDPTQAEWLDMWQKSPMRHVSEIKADVLFLIGSNDLRVPPSQGVHIYRTLKARGVNTKLHLYPDNHPLGTVPVHMDALINAAFWILESTGMPI